MINILVHKQSTNPIHIKQEDEDLSPSAFIPFCSYGSNMSSLGAKIDKFETTVCNSFKAKVLNHQLCYEVDVNNFIDKNIISQELNLGLSMLIDYNGDRQIGLVKQSNKESLMQRLGEYRKGEVLFKAL